MKFVRFMVAMTAFATTLTACSKTETSETLRAPDAPANELPPLPAPQPALPATPTSFVANLERPLFHFSARQRRGTLSFILRNGENTELVTLEGKVDSTGHGFLSESPNEDLPSSPLHSAIVICQSDDCSNAILEISNGTLQFARFKKTTIINPAITFDLNGSSPLSQATVGSEAIQIFKTQGATKSRLEVHELLGTIAVSFRFEYTAIEMVRSVTLSANRLGAQVPVLWTAGGTPPAPSVGGAVDSSEELGSISYDPLRRHLALSFEGIELNISADGYLDR